MEKLKILLITGAMVAIVSVMCFACRGLNTADDVDFYNVGTYPVKVQYRYQRTVRTTTYNVQVISSEFDASGVEYVGGIEVTYANKKAFDYDLDLTGTKTMNISQFRVKIHYYKSGTEIEEKAIVQSLTNKLVINHNITRPIFQFHKRA